MKSVRRHLPAFGLPAFGLPAFVLTAGLWTLSPPAWAAQDHAMQMQASPRDPGGAPESPADADMAKGMGTMQHDMSAVPMTGDADHDFVSMMLPHHQGAVSMARSELRYGKDPAMRRLARAIVAAQEHEIGLMNAWLKAHPAPAAKP